jgi:diguanylate cyclase (GGDEF)-like protein
MDGNLIYSDISLDLAAIDQLMPMHLCLSPAGDIISAGSTLAKLFPEVSLMAQSVFDLFEFRRPGGITDMAALVAHAGQRLYLGLRGSQLSAMRGIALPRAKSLGLLLNLSFGIGVIDAVRHHALTDADFAPTDLTVELMYLVEAKSAVMDELRNLNLRLQGAKVAAEEQAMTDMLTGLRNRRALDQDLASLARQPSPFCLMHIDLDYFKAVNDTLGHAAGDSVLREVAKVLCAETRHGDTVARVGGDEFVVVLPALADPVLLRQIANRIIARLSIPMDFEGQICRIAASIGMTLSTLYPNVDPKKMVCDADQALYASKRAGRARATLFLADDMVPNEDGLGTVR